MTNTPMTFEEWAVKHGMSLLKVGNSFSDDDVKYAHWVWSDCEQQNQAVIAELVEALKLADEAMMWDVGGEPMPSKEIEARAKIKDVLAKVKG